MLQNVNRWFTFCFQNTRLMRVNTYVLWTHYSLLVITTKSVNNGNVLCGRKKGMFSILRNWIRFTRFVLWISKFDFMLFLYHNNPGRSFAQGISSTWFNSAQFLCSKVQTFFCSPTHQKHTYFPQPQLRRFRSLSNLSIPTFHQFQPVVISIILACFLLAYNTSLHYRCPFYG